MMSLWDALRMNMMISYQELVRTFPSWKAFQPALASEKPSGNGKIQPSEQLHLIKDLRLE